MSSFGGMRDDEGIGCWFDVRVLLSGGASVVISLEAKVEGISGPGGVNAARVDSVHALRDRIAEAARNDAWLDCTTEEGGIVSFRANDVVGLVSPSGST